MKNKIFAFQLILLFLCGVVVGWGVSSPAGAEGVAYLKINPAIFGTKDRLPEVAPPVISKELPMADNMTPSPCVGSVRTFGFGISVNISHPTDTDCQELYTERAVREMYAKSKEHASHYHIAYQEDQEKRHFAEQMVESGFARFGDTWKVPNILEKYFADTPLEGNELFTLGLAAAILVIVFGFWYLITKISEPRIVVGNDRNLPQQRKHSS